MDMHDEILYFAKVREDAVIPTKKSEDAGYDLYSNFVENEIEILQNEIKLIPTGIACAFPPEYVLFIKERSSTGARGLSIRMGVVDSGYRGEIILGINNTSRNKILITKRDIEQVDNVVLHPYKKAIAQAVLLKLPDIKTKEIEYEDLIKIDSLRKNFFMGASGK